MRFFIWGISIFIIWVSSSYGQDTATGLVFKCANPTQAKYVKSQIHALIQGFGWDKEIVASRFLNSEETAFEFKLAGVSENAGTLNLLDRKELGLENESVTMIDGQNHEATYSIASKKEILAAIMTPGRSHVFTEKNCSLDKLLDHINIRQNIVKWTRAAYWSFPEDNNANKGGKIIDKKKWASNFTVQPGVDLCDALEDAWHGTLKYEVGCTTACKLLMVHPILNYYNEVKKDEPTVKQLKQLLGDDPLGDVEGRLLEHHSNVPGNHWVPGDWGYIINKDKPSASIRGYEGSNIIYIGGGQIGAYYNENEDASLDYYIKRVYCWRYGGNRLRSISPSHLENLRQNSETTKEGLVDPTRDFPLVFGPPSPTHVENVVGAADPARVVTTERVPGHSEAEVHATERPVVVNTRPPMLRTPPAVDPVVTAERPVSDSPRIPPSSNLPPPPVYEVGIDYVTNERTTNVPPINGASSQTGGQKISSAFVENWLKEKLGTHGLRSPEIRKLVKDSFPESTERENVARYVVNFQKLAQLNSGPFRITDSALGPYYFPIPSNLREEEALRLKAIENEIKKYILDGKITTLKNTIAAGYLFWQHNTEDVARALKSSVDEEVTRSYLDLIAAKTQFGEGPFRIKIGNNGEVFIVLASGDEVGIDDVTGERPTNVPPNEVLPLLNQFKEIQNVAATHHVGEQKSDVNGFYDLSRLPPPSEGTVEIKELPLLGGARWPFFKNTQGMEYKMKTDDAATAEEIGKCDKGSGCHLYGIFNNEPVPSVSVRQMLKRTQSGAYFRRMRHDVLKGMGLDPKVWHEAWRDPNGNIWTVPDIRDSNGQLARMNYKNAEKYCIEKGGEIPNEQDYIRLTRYLGAKSDTDPNGYSPNIFSLMQQYIEDGKPKRIRPWAASRAESKELKSFDTAIGKLITDKVNSVALFKSTDLVYQHHVMCVKRMPSTVAVLGNNELPSAQSAVSNTVALDLQTSTPTTVTQASGRKITANFVESWLKKIMGPNLLLPKTIIERIEKSFPEKGEREMVTLYSHQFIELAKLNAGPLRKVDTPLALPGEEFYALRIAAGAPLTAQADLVLASGAGEPPQAQTSQTSQSQSAGKLSFEDIEKVFQNHIIKRGSSITYEELFAIPGSLFSKQDEDNANFVLLYIQLWAGQHQYGYIGEKNDQNRNLDSVITLVPPHSQKFQQPSDGQATHESVVKAFQAYVKAKDEQALINGLSGR